MNKTSRKGSKCKKLPTPKHNHIHMVINLTFYKHQCNHLPFVTSLLRQETNACGIGESTMTFGTEDLEAALRHDGSVAWPDGAPGFLSSVGFTLEWVRYVIGKARANYESPKARLQYWDSGIYWVLFGVTIALKSACHHFCWVVLPPHTTPSSTELYSDLTTIIHPWKICGSRNRAGWWFFATPLKNMSSSIGMISNPIFLGK